MAPSLDLAFLRNRTALKRIAVVTVACAALGAAYALLAPRWYRSMLTIVPAKQQKAGISSMLGGELAGLAAGVEGSLGGGADAQRIAAVLQSDAVTDAVIAKFDLRTRYGERYQESAREALWRHCAVKPLPKPNLVELTCEDRDPRFVQELLTYFAEHGNQVFRRIGVSSATEEARFLDRRVAELRQQADDAATRMREFQEQHKIVDLDTQAKAVVAALATLNSQRIAKQIELDYARTFSAGDEASMQQLQSQLSVMRGQLHDLEDAPAESPASAETRRDRRPERGGGLFPSALAVPKLRADYEKLYRDRKVAETTLVFALERLEGAKASEARDVSTFLVLDPPSLPTRPARPKPLRAFGAFVAIGLASAIGFEWARSRGGLAAVRRHAAASAPPNVRSVS
jgi:tyrosine-protein kinase Etk/Wzc